MEKDIDKIYEQSFLGEKYNSKKLYEIIKLMYSGYKKYEIKLGNKIFMFQIKKIDNQYELEYDIDKKKINLFERIIIFYIGENYYTNIIYSSENLMSLLNYYQFRSPYIENNNQKIKINMEKSSQNDLKYFLENNLLIKIHDEKNESIDNYVVSQIDFDLLHTSNKDYIIDEQKEIFLPQYFGNYTTKYIKGIKEDENLFFQSNEGIRNLKNNTIYYQDYRDYGIFNFLTGPVKTGKSFSLLSLKTFENDNYRIYFNDRFITELEDRRDYKGFKKMFFYEIAKVFKTYNEYYVFAKNILEKMNKSEANFQNYLLEFIEEIDSFMENNSSKYKKMMIIFDDFELDERNPEKFNQNIEFIKTLYKKREKYLLVHFSFISPINDNYIKDCVLYALELEESENKATIVQKYEKKNANCFPFYFYNTCFNNPNDNDNNNKYIEKISFKNKNELNIPEKILKEIQYSLFHLNNIKNYCGENKDKETVSVATEIYFTKYQKEIDEYICNYYEKNNDNCLFRIDLEKVKEYHELITKEDIVEGEILRNILIYIPIVFLSFYMLPEIKNNKLIYKYQVRYLNEFYKISINKYLAQFENIDYDNKEIKNGEKGNILESKVIDAIKNKYFENFVPDKVIEISDIYKLKDFSIKDLSKYKEEINLFKEVFEDETYNLIMIKQKNDNAKRYDLAFLQKYSKEKYQFILVQITRKKRKKDMFQYSEVKNDCYYFADFFSFFENITVERYHFFFVFQTGINEDKNSMKFCRENNIKYIKYCEKNKQPYFLSSDNTILKSFIFNQTSDTLVECIKNQNLKNTDNYSYTSEYSLTGKKRTTISHISQAKYIFGIRLYQSVSKIFNNKNFELCERCYAIEENKIFHICYRRKGLDVMVYYLVYIKEGKEIIEIINFGENQKKEDINQENLKREIEMPGTVTECFQFLDTDNKSDD